MGLSFRAQDIVAKSGCGGQSGRVGWQMDRHRPMGQALVTGRGMDKSLADAVQRDIASWTAQETIRGRYPALCTIAGALHAMAIIVFVLGLLTLIGFIAVGIQSPPAAPVGIAVFIGQIAGIALVTFFYAIVLRAFSELIHVAIDIEKNTRDVAESLKK